MVTAGRWQCRQPEWLLVERIFQDRLHPLIAARSLEKCPLGGRLHPLYGILGGKTHDSQATAITPLGVRFLGQYELENSRAMNGPLIFGATWTGVNLLLSVARTTFPTAPIHYAHHSARARSAL